MPNLVKGDKLVENETADNPLNIVDAYNRACDENRELLSELQELKAELMNTRVCLEALVLVLLGHGEVHKAPSFVPEYVVKIDKNVLPTLKEEEGTEIKKHDIYIICE